MNNFTITRHQQSSESRKIIIVGAGAAGLAAAKMLLEAGHDITILEANDYIGGRILTVDLNSKSFAEFGASQIHLKNSQLYQYARKRGLLTSKTGRWDKAMFVVNDKLVSMFNLLFKSKFTDLYRIGKLYKSIKHYDGEDYPLSDTLDTFDLSPEFKKVFMAGLESALGGPLTEIGTRSLLGSLQSAGIRFETDIISVPVKCKFGMLLEPYIKTVSHCVKLDTAVCEIDYNDDMVKLRTESGEQFQADKVIVTVSLGVLKSGRLRFLPELPDDKQRAISSLGMGQGLKVAVRFHKRLWPSSLKYIIDSDRHIFYLINRYDNCDFTMVAFIVDEYVSANSDEQVKHLVRTSLDILFGKQAVDTNIAGMTLVNWSANPYFAGIYSYDRSGSQGSRQRLARPVDDKLFFAGEATVDGLFASVEGAILSGERAAEKILEDFSPTCDTAQEAESLSVL